MIARNEITSLTPAVIARGGVALLAAALISAGVLLLAGAINLLNWNACMCSAGGDDGPLYLKTFLLWVCVIAAPIGAVIAAWRIPVPAPISAPTATRRIPARVLIPLSLFAAVGASIPLALPFRSEPIGRFLAREGLFTASRLDLTQVDLTWVALAGAGLSLAALHWRAAIAAILATSTWLLLIGALSIADANRRDSTPRLGLLELNESDLIAFGESDLIAFGLPAYGVALITAWAAWRHTRRTGALVPAIAGVVPVAAAYLIVGSGTEGQQLGYGFAIVLLIIALPAGLIGGAVAARFGRTGPFRDKPAWVQFAALAVLVAPVLVVSLINLG